MTNCGMILAVAVIAIVIGLLVVNCQKSKENFVPPSRDQLTGYNGMVQSGMAWAERDGVYNRDVHTVPRTADTKSGQVVYLPRHDNCTPAQHYDAKMYTDVYNTSDVDFSKMVAGDSGMAQPAQAKAAPELKPAKLPDPVMSNRMYGKDVTDPDTYKTFHVHGIMRPTLKSRNFEHGTNMLLGTPKNIAVPDKNWSTSWFGLSGNRTEGSLHTGIFSSTVSNERLVMDKQIPTYKYTVCGSTTEAPAPSPYTYGAPPATNGCVSSQ